MMQVCPRCCLRHAGVRGTVYASAVPLASELLNTLSDAAAVRQSAAPAQKDPASKKTVQDAPGLYELPPALDAAHHTACARQPQQESAVASNRAAQTAAAAGSTSAVAIPEQNGHPMPATKSKNDVGEHSSTDPVCIVCLGVLQSLESLSLTAPAQNITAAVQQWDCASGREWQSLASCAPEDIAAQVK